MYNFVIDNNLLYIPRQKETHHMIFPLSSHFNTKRLIVMKYLILILLKHECDVDEYL